MKYLFILGVVAAIYYFFIRETPVAPVMEAITQSEAAPLLTGPRAPAAPAAPASSGIRRPIDRTHATLDKVRARNGQGEF